MRRRQFRKTAGFLDEFQRGWRGEPAGGIGGALGSQLPAALAAAGMTAAGYVLNKGINRVMDRLSEVRDYQAMLRACPDLAKVDARHVQTAYKTLRNLAPSLASEPIVAGTFVRDVLSTGETSEAGRPSIGPALAKMLLETERRIENEDLVQHLVDVMLRASPTPRISAREFAERAKPTAAALNTTKPKTSP